MTARKVIRQGEAIKYLSGTLVEITMEEEAELKRAKRDFSIVFSARKKKHKMFLGPARFANHDCRPNARLDADKNTEVMQVVALRELQPGEEITVDYGKDYFGPKNTDCLCATCEAKCKGRWLPRDDVKTLTRGRAGRETKRSTSTAPVQHDSESLERGRRRSRGGLSAEEPPTKRQKKTQLPPSPPPSHSSNTAESSSLASRGSEHEQTSQSPRHRHSVAGAKGNQGLEGQDPPQTTGARGPSRYIPTPSPFEEIPETPSPQPPREASPQLQTTLPFWPCARQSSVISLSSSVRADGTQHYPFAIDASDSYTDTSSSGPEPNESESDEDAASITSFDSLRKRNAYDDYPEESRSTSVDREACALPGSEIAPPTIIPPAELGRISRAASVESSSSVSSEGPQIARYPGDHYRTAAVLTMPGSRWIECRTCSKYWVQRSGSDTKRECPRCERHSKVYGFGWPKTDPKKSRRPEQSCPKDAVRSELKEEKVKTEKENRLWRGWVTVPSEDEARVMDHTFVKRFLSRAEEREQATKGKGLLKPGEVEIESSIKRSHQEVENSCTDNDSNSEADPDSPRKKRRVRGGDGRSTAYYSTRGRARRACAIAAQDNWQSNCRIRKDGTLNLGKRAWGFTTRKQRRNRNSESPKKSAEPVAKQEPKPQFKAGPSAANTMLRRVTSRGRITKPIGATTSPLQKTPNKAPLNRPGMPLMSLANRRPMKSIAKKPRTVRGVGTRVYKRKVGRPLGSTKKKWTGKT